MYITNINIDGTATLIDSDTRGLGMCLELPRLDGGMEYHTHTISSPAQGYVF
jgi:hypothetical protein